MPNDAKLGLAIGVGLVIAVAVIFFQRELVNSQPAQEKAAASVVSPTSPPARRAPRNALGAVPAQTTSRTTEVSDAEPYMPPVEDEDGNP
jgi:hypothetical protein